MAAGDLGDQIRAVVSATNSYRDHRRRQTAPVTIGSGAPAVTTGPTIVGPRQPGPDPQRHLDVEPRRRLLQLPVAELERQRHHVGEHRRRHRLHLHARRRPTSATSCASRSPPSTPTGPSPPRARASGPSSTTRRSTAPPRPLTGTPQRTGVLSTTAGTWTGLGNIITYQWQRSPDGTTWTGIDGATASTYTAQFADEGDVVRALVTATNPSGVTSTPTAPTQIIAPFPPANTAPPVDHRRGRARRDPQRQPRHLDRARQRLQPTSGSATPARATSTSTAPPRPPTRWPPTTRARPSACWSPPPTPTAPSPRPARATAPGHRRDPGQHRRAADRRHHPARVHRRPPRSGPGRGSATATPTSGSARPTAISWTNISGATASTYVVSQADEGDSLRVMVTVTNPDGTASTPSAATIVVPASPPAATTAPVVHRHRPARQRAHGQPGDLERRRQRLHLPVAALARRRPRGRTSPAPPRSPTRCRPPTRPTSCASP